MKKVIIVMRATDPAIRKKVVDLYLQGVGRNESARILGIGETTVTDIIHAWKRRIENQNQSLDEYESVRDLAITCKKNGISVADISATIRLHNFIRRLGPDVDEDQIEQYIAMVSSSSDPQRLIKTADQIAQISDVPLSELEERVRQRQTELEALSVEIERLKKEEQEARELVMASFTGMENCSGRRERWAKPRLCLVCCYERNCSEQQHYCCNSYQKKDWNCFCLRHLLPLSSQWKPINISNVHVSPFQASDQS